ncbi:MAG TPA: hypothetical protein DCL48_06435, partial [Alphaproteobacteria bacterium]|nr:hypothetical protein [Alphaproteobacteria bacterium]
SVVAAFVYFLAVFAVGFVLGTLRVFVMAPNLGETGAVLLEVPVMLAMSWVICGWVVRTTAVPSQLGVRIAMGAIAFGFLIAAEAVLGIVGFGRSWAQHWAEYQKPAAQFGLAAQMIFAAFPVLRLGVKGG